MIRLQHLNIKKILVFRALQLGDLLNSIPAIRALAMAIPDAKITLAGLPWAESLIARYPRYLHSFVQFPGYPGLPEQPFNDDAYQSFVATIKAEDFDLVIQMQGNGTIVNEMLSGLGAKHIAGFHPVNEENPDPDWFIPYPEGIHEIERHLVLVEHLGVEPQGKEIGFPITLQDLIEYNQLNINLQPQRYVCVHPGSRGSWRQWPPDHFAELANCCSEAGYTVVLTGTSSEMDIIENVLPHLKTKPVIAAGRTSLGGMAVLISNARLLISNCTGVAHVAAALKVPGIVISMDGEPERWGPLDKNLHFTIDWTKNPDRSLIMTETKKRLIDRPKRNELRDPESLRIS